MKGTMLWALVKETIAEAREHPALLAAIFMYPSGYRWRNGRWEHP